jgi:hypothetical protein
MNIFFFCLYCGMVARFLFVMVFLKKIHSPNLELKIQGVCCFQKLKYVICINF